jgi:hypothetical protein
MDLGILNGLCQILLPLKLGSLMVPNIHAET